MNGDTYTDEKRKEAERLWQDHAEAVRRAAAIQAELKLASQLVGHIDFEILKAETDKRPINRGWIEHLMIQHNTQTKRIENLIQNSGKGV